MGGIINRRTRGGGGKPQGGEKTRFRGVTEKSNGEKDPQKKAPKNPGGNPAEKERPSDGEVPSGGKGEEENSQPERNAYQGKGKEAKLQRKKGLGVGEYGHTLEVRVGKGVFSGGGMGGNQEKPRVSCSGERESGSKNLANGNSIRKKKKDRPFGGGGKKNTEGL